MKQIEEPNYYQLLNITPEAEVSEVIHAYHEICKKFSIFPYASEDEISRINNDFGIYKRAYITLTSSEDRKKYDESLRQLHKKREEEKNSYIKTISDTSDLENLLFLKDAPQPGNSETGFSKIKAEITANMFEKGKSYLENEKYHEAINMFRKLIDINSKDARYHSYLGLALLKKGWENYAQEEFKAALLLDPEDAIAVENFKVQHFTGKLNSRVTTHLSPDQVAQLKITEKPGIIEKLKNFFKKD